MIFTGGIVATAENELFPNPFGKEQVELFQKPFEESVQNVLKTIGTASIDQEVWKIGGYGTMELFGLVWKAVRYGTMEINHIREFHLAHAMVALLSEAGALQRYNISQYSVWQIICNRGGARHAAIHETLMNFPEKYSTIVGERGLKLSGGEKQRVSLGRAFLKAPSILLCDEVTSSLDSNTEAEILNALKTLSKNRTSIFIAHRLTVVMQCDEIIVLENDKVVQQGPHEYLLSRAGRYAQLWMQQNSTDTSDTAIKVGV